MKFVDLIELTKSFIILLDLSSNETKDFSVLTPSLSKRNEADSNISPSELHLSKTRGKNFSNLSMQVFDKFTALYSRIY